MDVSLDPKHCESTGTRYCKVLLVIWWMVPDLKHRLCASKVKNHHQGYKMLRMQVRNDWQISQKDPQSSARCSEGSKQLQTDLECTLYCQKGTTCDRQQLDRMEKQLQRLEYITSILNPYPKFLDSEDAPASCEVGDIRWHRWRITTFPTQKSSGYWSFSASQCSSALGFETMLSEQQRRHMIMVGMYQRSKDWNPCTWDANVKNERTILASIVFIASAHEKILSHIVICSLQISQIIRFIALLRSGKRSVTPQIL